MDGIEENHLLLARFHRARLHRDRQLDDGLDGAEAELEVGLPSIAVQKVKFWKRIRNQMRQGGITLPTGQAWRILLRQTVGSSLGPVET